MRNLKFIIGFACSGFFLSLFFGIFSHSKFGRVLLQALIFCIIFAILGFVIQFIFDKFLNDGSPSESIDSGTVENSGSGQRKGNFVDLVVQDEELQASESENQFFVGDNHQMLNDSDYYRGKTSDRSGFVPIQKESIDNLTGTEAFTKEEFLAKRESLAKSEVGDGSFVSPFATTNTETVTQDKKTGNSVGSGNNKDSFDSSVKRTEASGGENLDILPDMNDFSIGAGKEDETESENGFGTPSYSNSKGQSKNIEGIDPANASLMAKAISSILSEES